MIYFPIGLFAVAAILGLTMLILWMRKKNAPKMVIVSHGVLAASGLGFLIFYSLQNPDNFPIVSLCLFVAAALGGFYLVYNDQVKKKKLLSLAFLHGLLAVCAFVALILFAFSMI